MYGGSDSGRVLQQVRILFAGGSAVGLTDRDLLDRFLHDRDESGEAAFKALVERHGPMVLRVCKQALRDRHAAEDAFQATFLVLARQARSIRKRDSVGSWLFGVASRAAARIRMMEARRQRYEGRGASVQSRGDTQGPESSETWHELHAEIARLPEKYRVPIVLCYFEGLTHEQAAGRLGWPVGTVKTRLARGREQLRIRLGRRGWKSASLIPADALRPFELTEVPRLLLESTTHAAMRFVSGVGAGACVSSTVLAITQGVLRAMLINPLRLAAITLFGVSVIGLGAMVFARQDSEEPQADGQPGPASVLAEDSPQPSVLGLAGSTEYDPETLRAIRPEFPCRVDKVSVGIGAVVKTGEPLLELFSTKLAEAKSHYRAAYSRRSRDEEALEKDIGSSKEFDPARRERLADEVIKSRAHAGLAWDQLRRYGLTDEDMEIVRSEDAVQSPRLVVRSPTDGLVIGRSVVVGNVYDRKDTLLTMVRDDPLQVTANVDSHDASSLKIGQRMTVSFPFSDRAVDAKVKAIGPEVDPKTGTVKVRAFIANHDHRLKAGSLVNIRLELGPKVQPKGIAREPVQAKSHLSLDQRLNAVERKLDLLFGDKDSRNPNAKILERLSDLERKLDRALDLRPEK